MATFNINRFGFCTMRIIGVGWRNIMYLTYDMKDANGNIDTTPSLAKNHKSDVMDFLNNQTLEMPIGLQSIPYWCMSEGFGDGETHVAIPKIPFCEYDTDTEIGTLSQFELQIPSSSYASTIRGYEVDMSFNLGYTDNGEILNMRHGIGNDDSDLWGDITFHGYVPPFIHHEQGLADNGCTIYPGNYRTYNNTNYMCPYLYPILCIQGSRYSPISINMLSFACFNSAFESGFLWLPDQIGTTLSANLSGVLIDYGKKNRIEDWLYCSDFDTNYSFLNNADLISWTKYAEDIDPNDGWGESDSDTPVGGKGEGPLTQDDIVPTLPDASGIDTNFFAVYKCSKSDLNEFARYCWSVGVWETFTKKFYANPSDCVMGLMFMPFDVEAGDRVPIYLGDVNTEAYGNVVTKHFQKFDCGTININDPFDSYLSTDPYTKYQIALPFVGIQPLSADEINNKTLQVIYNIDVLTGGCVAHVIANGTTIASYGGSMGIQIPTTSQDLGQSVIAAMQAASTTATAVTGIAMGAGGAGMLASATPSMLSNTNTAISSGTSMLSSIKPAYAHSGSLSGNSGWLGIHTPYLIVTYPNRAIPEGQLALEGYPAFHYASLGSFRGYTECESVKLKCPHASDKEQQEIISLLKGGVFV